MVFNEEIVEQQSEINDVNTTMVTMHYYWQHLNKPSKALKNEESNIFEFE